KADVPSGAKLVPGNEVREGGYRVGVVSKINAIRLQDGSAGAQLVLKLDKKATPLPADTTIRIRPRSALGLKYVELNRGTGADTFDALSQDPQALKDTIAESPATLAVGTRSLRAQRPFLASLVNVSGELQGAAHALRVSAPPITSALRSGVSPLQQLPQLNR